MKTTAIALSILSTITSVIATDADAANAAAWPYHNGQCVPGLKYCRTDIQQSTWAVSDITEDVKNDVANVFICRESETGDDNRVELLGNCDEYHNGLHPEIAENHSCFIEQHGTVVVCQVETNPLNIGGPAAVHHNHAGGADSDDEDGAGASPFGSAWKA